MQLKSLIDITAPDTKVVIVATRQTFGYVLEKGLVDTIMPAAKLGELMRSNREFKAIGKRQVVYQKHWPEYIYIGVEEETA